MSGTILCINVKNIMYKNVLTHLFLPTILQSNYYYYPYFNISQTQIPHLKTDTIT